MIRDWRRPRNSLLSWEGIAHKYMRASREHDYKCTSANLYSVGTKDGRQHAAAVMEGSLSNATKVSRHLNEVI